MKRYIITLVCVFLALIIFAASTESPIPVYAQGGGEPRFSYPGAGRFELTSYMDHTNPNYTVDDDLTIYTTERGLENNGCADISLCYWSGGMKVCGYYTESGCGGRQIWYDGHPGIDYGFPMNTPVAAAAAGTSYRYTYSSSQTYAVVTDHGSDYWSKYLHVDRDTRISNNTSHNRGTQIALSSDSGTGLAHLHFETRYNGEWGTILDPYGWQGDWWTDPWNVPLYRTNDWWRSNAPIPMGYRDQNHNAVGPFELDANGATGAIGTEWEYLSGQPGSPVSDEYSLGSGIRRDFEKGYIEWNYSIATYHPYNSIALPDVPDERDEWMDNAKGWTSDVIARNGNTSAQISLLYADPDGRIIDSRTQATTPANGTLSVAADDIFDTNPIWGVADTFAGSASVYHEEDAAVIVESTHAEGNLASAYTGIKSPATLAYLPAFYKDPNIDSRFSVLNTSVNATTVSMSYYEENGTALGTHNHILGGGRQYTFDPNDCADVPANVCAASFEDGGVVLSASQPIAVTAETT